MPRALSGADHSTQRRAIEHLTSQRRGHDRHDDHGMLPGLVNVDMINRSMLHLEQLFRAVRAPASRSSLSREETTPVKL